MYTPGSIYPMFRINLQWVRGYPTGRWELRWVDVLTKWEKQVLYLEVCEASVTITNPTHWVSEYDIKLCREPFRFPEDYQYPTVTIDEEAAYNNAFNSGGR